MLYVAQASAYACVPHKADALIFFPLPDRWFLHVCISLPFKSLCRGYFRVQEADALHLCTCTHIDTGHLQNCELMDHLASSISEEVVILYVDSSRTYSLLSWLASPQMCACVSFGKRSTSNSKRGRRSNFFSVPRD